MRHPELNLNIPDYVFCMSWCADFEFRGRRINLITPGVTINADVERSFKNPKATFLRCVQDSSTLRKGRLSCSKTVHFFSKRELTYKSANGTRVNANYSMINTTKKNWMQREKEKSDKQSLVQMEKIKVFRGPGAPPRLTDTTIKPPLGGRGRRTGTLEIHSNGIRYKSAQNDPLDITYQNIKYAFYQDAVNELKSEYRDDHVRIHVHLRNEIMVGKKKTKDVQFTAQIGEDNIKLSDVRRSAYDPDELEDEQRERDRRRKINNMYKKFASKIQEESKKTAFAIEFDIPYKALCFTGRASMSTSKGEVTFMPTKDCLVDLSDPPFFILDVGEVSAAAARALLHHPLLPICLHTQAFAQHINALGFARSKLCTSSVSRTTSNTLMSSSSARIMRPGFGLIRFQARCAV